MKQAVALNDVSKVYNGDRGTPALEGITLAIPAAQVSAVMGPSGSGKSTLLNLIGGLDRPTRGTIVIEGQDLGRLSEAGLARFRRTRVGIIFQFFNLLNNLTALDNVLIPAQLAGVKIADARRRANDLLERLEITALRDQYPARMSGGPTPAGGHRACADQQPGAAPCRRAHRRARLAQWRPGARRSSPTSIGVARRSCS